MARPSANCVWLWLLQTRSLDYLYGGMFMFMVAFSVMVMVMAAEFVNYLSTNAVKNIPPKKANKAI